MDRVFGFIGIIVGLGVFVGNLWAENLVFNPGFDMSPWDTGWTIGDTGIALVESSSTWHSSPHSCKLHTIAKYPPDTIGSIGHAEIWQNVEKVINCTCRVYYQFWGFGVDSDSVYPPTEAGCMMKFIINGWEIGGGIERAAFGDTVSISTWTKWEHIFGSTDTITAVGFDAFARAESCAASEAEAICWVDDVYVSGEKIGVEETGKSNYKLQKLEVYPNPSFGNTVIKYGVPERANISLKLYDISGRLVKTIYSGAQAKGYHEVSIKFKELSKGVYFIQLKVVHHGVGEFIQKEKITVLN